MPTFILQIKLKRKIEMEKFYKQKPLVANKFKKLNSLALDEWFSFPSKPRPRRQMPGGKCVTGHLLEVCEQCGRSQFTDEDSVVGSYHSFCSVLMGTGGLSITPVRIPTRVIDPAKKKLKQGAGIEKPFSILEVAHFSSAREALGLVGN